MTISYYIIPIFVLLIIIYGKKKKIDIYSSFLTGAMEGFKISLSIAPSIIAMVFAINIFTKSGVLNFLIFPIKRFISFPPEILTLAALRPISGTSTLSIMTNIFKSYGPDSYSGFLSSIIQGCTDTTIYVMALYYSSIGVKKIRYNLVVGLFADFIGIIMAFILTNIFF